MNILGVDVGSTMAKFALIDGEEGLVKELWSSRINGDPEQCIEDSFAKNKKRLEYDCMAVTGSSRNLIGEKYKADLTKPEIIAHVYGVRSHLGNDSMIIEIGGQDSKLIMLQNKVISNFRMNSNCAAGTGSFIEAQARRFDISLEELDKLALSADSSVELNAKCATFLESALINLQRTGYKKNILAATVFNALASNYLASLCQGVNMEDYENIFFIGGVARLSAMKEAFERKIGKKIIVPDNCEYMGAIGVANMLLSRRKNGNLIDNGCNLNVVQCKDCINRCILKQIQIGDKVKYTGGLCGKHGM